MQSQEHWEIGYLFVFYSVKEKGWLCKICTQNGEGEYWRTKAVKIRERPNRRFVKHQASVIQIKAMKKRQECKSMLTKGNIYKCTRDNVLKKPPLKPRIVEVKKNWTVKENFDTNIVFFILILQLC